MKYLILGTLVALGWFFGVKEAIEFLFPELMASEYAKSVPLIAMIGAVYGSVVVTAHLIVADLSLSFKKITKE